MSSVPSLCSSVLILRFFVIQRTTEKTQRTMKLDDGTKRRSDEETKGIIDLTRINL